MSTWPAGTVMSEDELTAILGEASAGVKAKKAGKLGEAGRALGAARLGPLAP